MQNDWLDTETQAMLQRQPPQKLAPPTTACFALVLLERGADSKLVVRALTRTRDCPESEAESVSRASTPAAVATGLTYEGALMGQFELISADCISVFVEEHVVSAAENYLDNLYGQLRRSPEFALRRVELKTVPTNESGARFLDQFLGITNEEFQNRRPLVLDVAAKKARIMQHWADKIGCEVIISERDT